MIGHLAAFIASSWAGRKDGGSGEMIIQRPPIYSGGDWRGGGSKVLAAASPSFAPPPLFPGTCCYGASFTTISSSSSSSNPAQAAPMPCPTAPPLVSSPPRLASKAGRRRQEPALDDADADLGLPRLGPACLANCPSSPPRPGLGLQPGKRGGGLVAPPLSPPKNCWDRRGISLPPADFYSFLVFFFSFT